MLVWVFYLSYGEVVVLPFRRCQSTYGGSWNCVNISLLNVLRDLILCTVLCWLTLLTGDVVLLAWLKFRSSVQLAFVGVYYDSWLSICPWIVLVNIFFIRWFFNIVRTQTGFYCSVLLQLMHCGVSMSAFAGFLIYFRWCFLWNFCNGFVTSGLSAKDKMHLFFRCFRLLQFFFELCNCSQGWLLRRN